MSTRKEYESPVVPADWVPGPPQGEWTYEDYLVLPDDGKRYEVVQGVLYMPPSPNVWHQRAAGAIFYHLYKNIHLAGLGEVFSAPFDVILGPKDKPQPDVLVVLNEHLDRITKAGVMGAPDLVVEIVSPASFGLDRGGKLVAYANAGVPEYWIVTPDKCTVELLILQNGEYQPQGVFYGSAVLPSRVLPGFNVKVEQFFPQ
jgi:Uma2 family endonuclease